MNKKLKLISILAMGILFSSGVFSCKKKVNEPIVSSSLNESTSSESSSVGSQTSSASHSSSEESSSSVSSSHESSSESSFVSSDVSSESSTVSSSESSSESSVDTSSETSSESSSTQSSDIPSSEDKYGVGDVIFNDQTYTYSEEGVKLEAKCFDDRNLKAKYYYNDQEVTTLTEVGEYLITCKIYYQDEVVFEKDATIKIEKIKLPIPYQKEVIVYDGVRHRVELENFDSELMILNGEYSEIYANEYQALVYLTDPEHYEWGKDFNGEVTWHIYSKGVDKLLFTLSEDKTYYILTSCGDYTSKEITIPDKYNNLPVREIATRAFYCAPLTEVTIPSWISKINDEAFYQCSSLTNVYFHGNVDEMGENIFYQCGLNSSSIGCYVYNNGIYFGKNYEILLGLVDKTVTSFEVKEGTKSINFDAFNNCSSLTSITLPDSLQNIPVSFSGLPNNFTYNEYQGGLYLGSTTNPYLALCDLSKSHTTNLNIHPDCQFVVNNAINESDNVSEINIPKSIKYFRISDQVKFDKVYYSGSLSDYLNIDDSYFNSLPNNHFYYQNKSNNFIELIDLVVPNEITEIKKYRFKSFLNLKSISTSRVNSIGMHAFEGCSSLTDLDLSLSLRKIEDYAFSNCNKLEEVILPDSLESVGYYLFVNSNSIKKLTIPHFYNASENKLINPIFLFASASVSENDRIYQSLEEITITQGIEVTSNSFDKFLSLKRINFLDKDITLDTKAFEKTPEGLEVYYNGDISDFVNIEVSKDGSIFYNDASLYLLGEDDQYQLLSSLNIPEGVEKINDNIFAYGKFESINLPKTLLEIGDYAFYNVSVNNGQIELPNRVYKIGDYAFSYSNLKTIRLSKYLNEIGEKAFYYCENLTNLYLDKHVKSIDYGCFTYCKNLSVLYFRGTIDEWCLLPIDEYQSLPMDWARTFIYYNDKGEFVRNNNFVISKQISEIKDNTFKGFDTLESITFEGNISYIGDNAFYDCISLKEINFTELVSEIGKYAFYNCEKLTSFTLSDEVTVIKEGTFSNCKSLTELELPSELITIEKDALKNCSSLVNLILPNKLTTIGSGALNGCSSITNLVISDSVESLPRGLLLGCTSIESLTIPFVGESSKTKDDLYQYPLGYIFGTEYYTSSSGKVISTVQSYYESSLSEKKSDTFHIPYSLTSVTVTKGEILAGAFSNMTNLRRVAIKNATMISEGAFENCTNIRIIILNDNLKEIGDRAFFGLTYIDSVNLKNVSSIGQEAFKNCNAMTTVFFNNQLNSVGSNAFSNVNLNKLYFNGTFEEYLNMDLSNWKFKLTSIAKEFYYKENGSYKLLTDIVIPTGVTNIPANAFYGLKNINSLTLNKDVVIGENAFKYSKINKLYFNGSLEDWCNIDLNNLKSNPLEVADEFYYLNDENQYVLLENLVLKDIDNLNSEQFRYFKSIKTITLENINQIGDHCFSDLENLLEIKIVNCPSIGEECFFNCPLIKKLDIDQINGYTLGNLFSKTSIDNHYLVSQNNSEVTTDYYIPNSLKEIYISQGEIPQGGLEGFVLDKLVLRNGITTLISGCLNNASITNLEFSNSVNQVELDVFNKAKSIDSTYFNGNLIDWMNIDFSSWSSFVQDKTSNLYFLIDGDYQVIEEIVIPEGISEIGAYQFYKFTKLKTITLPSTITKVGDCAFKYNVQITRLVLPNNITEFGKDVLYGCMNLEYLEVPFLGKNKELDTDNSTLRYLFGSAGIASKLKTIKVNGEIGSNAFSSCRELETIILSNTTEIHSGAFENCSSLKNLYLSDNLNSIANNAFSNCNALTNIYYQGSLNDYLLMDKSNWETSPMVLGQSFFYLEDNNYVELTNLVLPSNITKVEPYSFYGFDHLSNVTLSDNLVEIASHAFMDCKMITNINLPSSLKSIGSYAFYNTSLNDITLPSGINYLGDNFSNCATIYYQNTIDGYFNIEFETKLSQDQVFNILNDQNEYCALNEINSITLPDTITVIPAKQFNGFSNLKTVTLPNTITEIGDYAFANCTSLSQINLPSSLTSIGDYAFNKCSSLTNIEFPSSLLSIGSYAFEECNLESINLNEGIQSLGEGCFKKNINLLSVSIPGCLDTIPSSCFSTCSQLNSLTLGEGISKVSGYAFAYCSSIEEILIPESVTYIGGSVFLDCCALRKITIPFVGTEEKTSEDTHQYPIGNLFGTYSKNISSCNKTSQSYYYSRNSDGTLKTTTSDYYIPKSLKEVVVLRGNILYGSFMNMSTLTSVILPNDLTRIEHEAFYKCSSLQNFVFPKSLTYIGSSSFSYASGFGELVLPEGLTEIGNGAFGYSTVRQVTIPSSLLELPDYCFRNCNYLDTVTLPKSLTKISANAFYYSSAIRNVYYLGNVEEWININASSSAFTYLMNSSSTLYVTNELQEFEQVKSVRLPDTVTSIGSNIDSIICRFGNVEEIIIPSTVTSIDPLAFKNLGNLSKLTVDEANPIYDSRDNCNAIIETSTNKLIHGTINTIIPSTVTSIGDYGFYKVNIVELNIPDSVVSIGRSAFSDCKKLTKITLPSNLTTISSNLFYMCSLLTSLVIPNQVTSIGTSVFKGCSNLTYLVIPKSLVKIGDESFYNTVTKLKAIYYLGTSDEFNLIDQGNYNNCFTNATKYFYSETSQEGMWHYQEGTNMPVLW